MNIHVTSHNAHRCSFTPDRRDPYLRLGKVKVFVRDQDRSLRFYLDQLGFALSHDDQLPSGARWLAVSPPDGTAMLELVAPQPDSQEYELIGRPTQVAFLTEDLFAKFEEWRRRGVRFHQQPQTEPWGAMSTTFEDTDGNSFTLSAFDAVTREVEALRRSHVEKLESERRAARELEIAKETQTRLFPQTLPALRTLDCRAVCLQAFDVGGDYYDFLDLGRGRLGLVVGDVSGKGTAAALLMANLQAHLHSLCGSYWNRPFTPFVLDQPARFLQTVNRLFYENTSENAYATLFFAEYDDNTGQLRYANCGHPSALLLRNDSGCERLDSTCPVMGLSKDWDCTVGERRLLPGDVLTVYTDGVSESFNDEGEEFGEKRLIETLQRHRELAPQALLASLADEVRQFSPHEQHDDITLVVAKCIGEGS
jgi:serine phosphatase RsbU (regulator of sigma subunit)/predicted enzyme related to lactoylglutathione lyase